jgi:hypothetical protein
MVLRKDSGASFAPRHHVMWPMDRIGCLARRLHGELDRYLRFRANQRFPVVPDAFTVSRKRRDRNKI